MRCPGVNREETPRRFAMRAETGRQNRKNLAVLSGECELISIICGFAGPR